MRNPKNEAGNLLPMTVTEGVTVNVLPSVNHEFLMSTKEVAAGYGVSSTTVRRHIQEHSAELIENKHFVRAAQFLSGAVQKMNGDLKLPHNAILWTKRGIVRLGFFIRSERAKLFRDWAEELVIRVEEQRDLFGGVSIVQAVPVGLKQAREKRLINRLDRDRLIRLLTMASRIEDSNLRLAITSELTGGLNYGAV